MTKRFSLGLLLILLSIPSRIVGGENKEIIQPPDELAALIEVALDQPEVRTAKLDEEIKQIGIQAARAKFGPSIDLFVGLGTQLDPTLTYGLFGGIEMTLPVLTPAEEGVIKEAKLSAERETITRELKTKGFILTVLDAYREYQSYYRLAGANQQPLDETESIVRLDEERNRESKISNSSLSLVTAQFDERKRIYAEANRNLRESKSRLAALLGLDTKDIPDISSDLSVDDEDAALKKKGLTNHLSQLQRTIADYDIRIQEAKSWIEASKDKLGLSVRISLTNTGGGFNILIDLPKDVNKKVGELEIEKVKLQAQLLENSLNAQFKRILIEEKAALELINYEQLRVKALESKRKAIHETADIRSGRELIDALTEYYAAQFDLRAAEYGFSKIKAIKNRLDPAAEDSQTSEVTVHSTRELEDLLKKQSVIFKISKVEEQVLLQKLIEVSNENQLNLSNILIGVQDVGIGKIPGKGAKDINEGQLAAGAKLSWDNTKQAKEKFLRSYAELKQAQIKASEERSCLGIDLGIGNILKAKENIDITNRRLSFQEEKLNWYTEKQASDPNNQVILIDTKEAIAQLYEIKAAATLAWRDAALADLDLIELLGLPTSSKLMIPNIEDLYAIQTAKPRWLPKQNIASIDQRVGQLEYELQDARVEIIKRNIPIELDFFASIAKLKDTNTEYSGQLILGSATPVKLVGMIAENTVGRIPVVGEIGSFIDWLCNGDRKLKIEEEEARLNLVQEDQNEQEAAMGRIRNEIATAYHRSLSEKTEAEEQLKLLKEQEQIYLDKLQKGLVEISVLRGIRSEEIDTTRDILQSHYRVQQSIIEAAAWGANLQERVIYPACSEKKYELIKTAINASSAKPRLLKQISEIEFDGVLRDKLPTFFSIVQIGRDTNPLLSDSGGTTTATTTDTFDVISGSQALRVTPYLGVSWDLRDALDPSLMRIADLSVDQNQALVEKAVLEATIAFKQLYAKLAAQEAHLELVKTNGHTLLQRLLEIAKTIDKYSPEKSIETMDVGSEMNRCRRLQVIAEDDLNKTRIELFKLLQTTGFVTLKDGSGKSITHFDVPGSSINDITGLIDEIVEKNPTLRSSALHVRIAKLDVQRNAINTYLPKLTATALIGERIFAGIEARWTLFDGGKQAASLDIAKKEEGKAKAQHQRNLVDLTAHLKLAIQELPETAERLNHSLTRVRRGENLVVDNMSAYFKGSVKAFDVMLSVREMESAYNDYVQQYSRFFDEAILIKEYGQVVSNTNKSPFDQLTEPDLYIVDTNHLWERIRTIISDVKAPPTQVTSHQQAPQPVDANDGVDAVPFATGFKLGSFVPLGGWREVRPIHHSQRYPPDFETDVTELLSSCHIRATDQHLLNHADWCVLLDELLKRYQFDEDTFKRVRRYGPIVFETLSPLHRSDQMPFFMQFFVEPAFKDLFPDYFDIMSDSDVAVTVDENLLKKLGLSLYYARLSQIYEQPGGILSTEMLAKHGVADIEQERFNRMTRLIHQDAQRLLERLPNQPAKTTDKLADFIEWQTQLARRVESTMLSKIDPIAIARLRQKMVSAAKVLYPEEAIRSFDDIRSMGILHFISSSVMARGWEDKPQLIEAYSKTVNIFAAELNKYYGEITLPQLVNRPEAERLKLLIEYYNAATDYLEKKWLGVQILEEQNKLRKQVATGSAIYWVNRFVRDATKGKDFEQATEEQLGQAASSFRELIGYLIEVKQMPETKKLVNRQLGISEGIGWFYPEVQGLLIVNVLDSITDNRGVFKPRELQSYLSNLIWMIDHGKREIAQYYNLLGTPMPEKLQSVAEQSMYWGKIGGITQALMRLRDYKREPPEALLQTLQDLIAIQTFARREGISLESGTDFYICRLIDGKMPGERYQSKPGLSRTKTIEEFIADLAAAKNRYKIIGEKVQQELEAIKAKPQTRPWWMSMRDLNGMLGLLTGTDKHYSAGLIDIDVSVQDAVAMVSRYISLRNLTREDLLNETANELFLQSIYIYHHKKDPMVSGLPSQVLGSYLEQIRRGARTRDEVAAILKYDGILGAKLLSLPFITSYEIQMMQHGNQGVTGGEFEQQFNLITDNQRLGLATRIYRLQELGIIDKSERAGFEYIQNWVLDAAYTQALMWINSEGKFILPFLVLNSSIETFRQGRLSLHRSQRYALGKRIASIFKLDPSYRDLGPNNNIRLLWLAYYVAVGVPMAKEEENWWLTQWEIIRNEMKSAGRTESEIEGVQQDFVSCMLDTREVFLDIVVPALYRNHPDNKHLEGMAQPYWLKLRDLISHSVIESLVNLRERKEESAAFHRKMLAEEEVVKPVMAKILEEREARRIGEKDKYKDPRFRVALKDFMSRYSHESLTTGKIGFYTQKAEEMGYTRQEAYLRFIKLPQIVSSKLPKESLGNIDSRDKEAIIGSLTDEVFNAWGIVDPSDQERVAEGLKSKVEHGLTTIRSVDEGLPERTETTIKQIDLADCAFNLFKKYSFMQGAKGEIWNEALRTGASAFYSRVSKQALENWLVVAARLRTLCRELKLDLPDEAYLFYADTALKLGVARVYYPPKRDYEQHALITQIEDELPFLFTPAQDIKHSDLPPSIHQLTTEPTTARSLQIQLAQNPARKNEILENISRKLVDQQLDVLDLRRLTENIGRRQELIDYAVHKLNNAEIFDELAGTRIEPLSEVELLIHIDERQSNPMKKLHLLNLLFPNAANKEMARLDWKTQRNLNESARQIELPRIMELVKANDRPFWAKWLLGENHEPIEHISLAAFIIAIGGSIIRVVAFGRLNEPMRGLVSRLQEWSPNITFRFNILLFNFLIIFWTTFLALWGLVVFNPNPEAFSTWSAVLFLLPLAYLLRVFPALTILQIIVYPRAILTAVIWILGMIYYWAGSTPLNHLLNHVLHHWVFIAVIILHGLLILICSKTFHRFTKSPYAIIRHHKSVERVASKTFQVRGAC